MVEAEQEVKCPSKIEPIPEEFIFTFGKYKGCTLQQVVDINLSYVYWCIGNVPWFKLPEGTKLPPRPRRIIWMEDDEYWDDPDDIYGWGGQDWDW